MAGTKGLINWQRPMLRVLFALVPIALSAIYFFGWRALLVLAVVNLAGFLSEYAFARHYRERVSAAVFVSGCLFAFSLPPGLPLWMAVIGIVFGIVFGKMVFGGFGKNIFNPALTGRAFIYVCFGGHMTAHWARPVESAWGGFTAWASDAVTQATPGTWLKLDAAQLATRGVASGDVALVRMLLGNTAGTLGGTSVLLVIAGGLYLLWTSTANYRIVVSAFAGYALTQTVVWLASTGPAVDPLRGALAGSFVFGAFFYATDPVSASKTNEGRWLYGALIGIMSSLISSFSVWPAGTMFSILLANMFAPIGDHAVRAIKTRRRA